MKKSLPKPYSKEPEQKLSPLFSINFFGVFQIGRSWLRRVSGNSNNPFGQLASGDDALNHYAS